MEKSRERFADLIRENRKNILDAWLTKIREISGNRFSELMSEAALMKQSHELLENLTAAMRDGSEEDMPGIGFEKLTAGLREMSAMRAEQGFTPLDTASYIFSLKDVLFQYIREACGEDADALGHELLVMNKIIDRMGILTFSTYSETREEIIQRQSRAILELSTPVIKAWNGMVLLPLVGIIDTVRSQEMIERLLQGIVDNEALVVVIDISGVPVIDTRVAQHLMKTVTAATMLGSEVILTGISPEIAQTIIKLDIDLGIMRTRGSLKAGIEDAFNLLGLRIIPKKEKNQGEQK